MSSEHYDESNEVWPYFLLTVVGVALVPATVSLVWGALSAAPARGGGTPHGAFRARGRRGALASPKLWLVAAGWVVVAALVAFIRSIDAAEAGADVWDPYAILNVARSASTREIKSAYRKLSLQYHPDKLRDLAEAEMDRAADFYVEIAKAYQALTDEVTRANFLEFGHPDGPQPVVHGIALPAFLFAPTASVGVLAFYVLLFGVGVPLAVGQWWKRTLTRTRGGLLQATAEQFVELLVKEQPHFITRSRILAEVAGSADMAAALGARAAPGAPLAAVDARVAQLTAFLARREPAQHDELVVAAEAARLVLALHTIAVEFRNARLCERLLDIHRQIVQAVSSAQLATAPRAQPQARDVPQLRVLRAQFHVAGESEVTPNSLVFLSVQYQLLPAAARAPEVPAATVDAAEAALRAYCATRPPASWNERQPLLGLARAPHFPLDVDLRWYAYLVSPDGKLAQNPVEVARLDTANLALSDADIAAGRATVGSLVVPFAAPCPMEPVELPFALALVSTCYFGADARADAVLKVVPPRPAAAKELDEGLAELEREDDSGASSDEDDEGLSDIDTSTEEEDNVPEK